MREEPSALQAINLKWRANPMFSTGRVLVALSLVLGCQLVHASAYLLESQAAANSDVQTRSKAYEEACVRSLRTLNTAQVTLGGDPEKGFDQSLAQLEPKGKGFIEAVLATTPITLITASSATNAIALPPKQLKSLGAAPCASSTATCKMIVGDFGPPTFT